jgi:hypothetical protein
MGGVSFSTIDKFGLASNSRPLYIGRSFVAHPLPSIESCKFV